MTNQARQIAPANLINDLRTVLKHAKQGIADPRFAKDQCYEISQHIERLIADLGESAL